VACKGAVWWQNFGGKMSWVHLIFGLMMFIVFVTTGKIHARGFPDKDAIPQELRLLMRSRHIYILFSGLIHLVLGVYCG
jgi:hypothetical protein